MAGDLCVEGSEAWEEMTHPSPNGSLPTQSCEFREGDFNGIYLYLSESRGTSGSLLRETLTFTGVFKY